MLAHVFSIKFIILYVYIVSAAYTQFRGKVRYKFFRQLFDHSTFMSPVNALMYLFSAVPNQVFFDRKQFPQLNPLQENWQTIRDEAQKLFGEGYIRASEKFDDVGFNSFFKTGWKRFYLKWYDACLPSAESLCPKTIELLKSIPSIKGAMFALLPNDGRLVRHRDPFAGSLRYHLGLITPNSEKCHIYVDGEMYYWKDGEDVMFDETYIHHAENKSGQDRIILFCDVERPLRSKLVGYVNHFFSKYVMAESATQNLPMDRVGFLNKIFKYLYEIRRVGKRLKKFNKKLYYLVKYALFFGIFYGIFFAH